MATNIERVQALFGALTNKTIGGAKAEEMADNFVYLRRAQIVDAGLDPDALTANQKARVVLDHYKENSVRWAHDAAHGEVLSAGQATIDSAEADFDEVP